MDSRRTSNGSRVRRSSCTNPPRFCEHSISSEKTPVHTAIVVDEFGSLQGIVTRTDLLEKLAGDLPKIDAVTKPKVTRAKTAPTSSMPRSPSPM